MKKLIITYSLTGSAKHIIEQNFNQQDVDIITIKTKVEIPKTMFKAGFVISTKNLGSEFEQIPEYKNYDQIIIIIPVWMGKPAKVFTEVYKKYPFTNKQVSLYLTSLGASEKPMRILEKLIAPNNQIVTKRIYYGKGNDKQLIDVV